MSAVIMSLSLANSPALFKSTTSSPRTAYDITSNAIATNNLSMSHSYYSTPPTSTTNNLSVSNSYYSTPPTSTTNNLSMSHSYRSTPLTTDIPAISVSPGSSLVSVISVIIVSILVIMTIGCILISIALYKKQVCNILQDQLQHGIGIDGNDRKCTKADTTVKKSDKISSTTAVDIPITVNESYTSVSFDKVTENTAYNIVSFNQKDNDIEV